MGTLRPRPGLPRAAGYAVNATSPDADARARFAAYVARLALAPRGAAVPYPNLASAPWHDPSTFALVRSLEANAGALVRELRAVDQAAFVPESEDLARRGRWDVAFFYERGRRHDAMAARCPQTMAAIDGARTVRSPSGLAYLSRLSASSHVAPHRGPTNVRLRCHFGVDIPDDCAIVVGGEERTWEEGRCLVFDDSFEHEAWNRDVRDRIVLIVDLWHPDLSDDEVRLLDGLDRVIEARARNLAAYHGRNESVRLPSTEKHAR